MSRQSDFAQPASRNGIDLKFWVFRLVGNKGFNVVVEGYREVSTLDDSATQLKCWKSSAITEVLDSRTMQTGRGSLYRLVGMMDLDMARSLNYPDDIIQLFMHGFPPNTWKHVLMDYCNTLRQGARMSLNTRHSSFGTSMLVENTGDHRRSSSQFYGRVQTVPGEGGDSAKVNQRKSIVSRRPTMSALNEQYADQEFEEQDESPSSPQRMPIVEVPDDESVDDQPIARPIEEELTPHAPVNKSTIMEAKRRLADVTVASVDQHMEDVEEQVVDHVEEVVEEEVVEPIEEVEELRKTPEKTRPPVASPRMSTRALKHTPKILPARARGPQFASPRRLTPVLPPPAVPVVRRSPRIAATEAVPGAPTPNMPPPQTPNFTFDGGHNKAGQLESTRLEEKEDDAHPVHDDMADISVIHKHAGAPKHVTIAEDTAKSPAAPIIVREEPSTELPTADVTLVDWVFKLVYPNFAVIIQGDRTDTGVSWLSTPVVHRYNARLLRTQNNKVYALEGNMSAEKSVAPENHYPAPLIGYFVDGFPVKWHGILEAFVRNRAAANLLGASSRLHDTMVGNDEDDEVAHEDDDVEHEDEPIEDDQFKRPLPVSALNTSRSGRVVKQRTASWAGERYKYDVHGNVIGTSKVTTETQATRDAPDTDMDPIARTLQCPVENNHNQSEMPSVRRARISDSSESSSPASSGEVDTTREEDDIGVRRGAIRRLESGDEDSSASSVCDDPECFCQCQCDECNEEREQDFDSDCSSCLSRRAATVRKRVLTKKANKKKAKSSKRKAALTPVVEDEEPAKPKKKRWTNDETKMLQLALEARLPSTLDDWAVVASSMPNNRTVDECQRRAEDVIGWSFRLQEMQRESQRREQREEERAELLATDVSIVKKRDNAPVVAERDPNESFDDIFNDNTMNATMGDSMMPSLALLTRDASFMATLNTPPNEVATQQRRQRHLPRARVTIDSTPNLDPVEEASPSALDFDGDEERAARYAQQLMHGHRRQKNTHRRQHRPKAVHSRTALRGGKHNASQTAVEQLRLLDESMRMHKIDEMTRETDEEMESGKENDATPRRSPRNIRA